MHGVVRVRIVQEGRGVRVSVQSEQRRARVAWVTLITTDSYARGVACLARSLVDVGSAHELIVMCGGELTAETMTQLSREVCTVRRVEPFDPFADDSHARKAYASERFGDCWTKLRLFEWTEYDRIAFLDADMCLTRNMDALLADAELPSDGLLAVQECTCFRKDHARRECCPYLPPSGWARHIVDDGRVVRAVRPGVGAYFNAGLLVFSPSRSTFRAFERTLSTTLPSDFRFAEQDFLNDFFRDRWRALPYTFNAMKCFFGHHRRDGLWSTADVRNVHYTHAKPWCLTANHKGYGRLNRLWWSTYLRHDPKLSGGTLQRMMLVMLIKAKRSGNATERQAELAGGGEVEDDDAISSSSSGDDFEVGDDNTKSSTTDAHRGRHRPHRTDRRPEAVSTDSSSEL